MLVKKKFNKIGTYLSVKHCTTKFSFSNFTGIKSKIKSEVNYNRVSPVPQIHFGTFTLLFQDLISDCYIQ